MDEHQRRDQRDGARDAPGGDGAPEPAPTPLAGGLRRYYGLHAGASFDAAMSGGGAPLPWRAELQQSFGADLSGVRVALGRRAALFGLGARAAARGDEVAFASHSPSKEEVAHEIAHTQQARRARDGGVVQRLAAIGRDGGAAEREAEALAPRAAAGERVQVREAPTDGIHLIGYDKLAELVHEACGGDEDLGTEVELRFLERLGRRELSDVDEAEAKILVVGLAHSVKSEREKKKAPARRQATSGAPSLGRTPRRETGREKPRDPREEKARHPRRKKSSRSAAPPRIAPAKPLTPTQIEEVVAEVAGDEHGLEQRLRWYLKSLPDPTDLDKLRVTARAFELTYRKELESAREERRLARGEESESSSSSDEETNHVDPLEESADGRFNGLLNQLTGGDRKLRDYLDRRFCAWLIAEGKRLPAIELEEMNVQLKRLMVEHGESPALQSDCKEPSKSVLTVAGEEYSPSDLERLWRALSTSYPSLADVPERSRPRLARLLAEGGKFDDERQLASSVADNLVVGEYHHQPDARLHLAARLPELRQLGYTTLGIEAPAGNSSTTVTAYYVLTSGFKCKSPNLAPGMTWQMALDALHQNPADAELRRGLGKYFGGGAFVQGATQEKVKLLFTAFDLGMRVLCLDDWKEAGDLDHDRHAREQRVRGFDGLAGGELRPIRGESWVVLTGVAHAPGLAAATGAAMLDARGDAAKDRIPLSGFHERWS